MSRRYLFTSESVTEGHPDKVCDQISYAILDALLAQDPLSRVACETVANTGLVLITGEITSKATVDYAQIARQKIAEIGYTFPELGFSDRTVSVQVALDRQSADISDGVNRVQHADADPLDAVTTRPPSFFHSAFGIWHSRLHRLHRRNASLAPGPARALYWLSRER